MKKLNLNNEEDLTILINFLGQHLMDYPLSEIPTEMLIMLCEALDLEIEKRESIKH